MSIILPNYSARDPAITQRPTSTAILAIDSEDRYKSYIDERIVSVDPAAFNKTPYDFTIQKGEPLLNGALTRIGVNEITFPWTIPNINAKTRRIRVSWVNAGVPGGPSTVVLDEGFYTPADIAATLQAKIRLLNVGLAAFTMTYGVNFTGIPTPSFQYNTNNAAVTISFDALPYNSAIYPYSSNAKQLYDILGFNDSNTLLAQFGGGVSTYCQAIRYVDIVCSQLTANQAVKDSMSQPISRDILARLYVGAAPGVQSTVKCSAAEFCPPGCMPTTLHLDYSQAKQIAWLPNTPIGGFLRFQVYDDTGDLLTNSFTNFASADGSNWSITMLATEN
jgi:hypothetical protein